jgi:hypothetical protein
MALGGVIGGILGSAVGGPLGASIGTGLGQAAQGAFQKKQGQAMSPSPVDVGRQKLLLDLYRMQQAKKTGTAYNPQITAGKQMAKSFMKNSFNAGGQVNQGAYSGLLEQTMNNIAAQSAQDVTQNYALIDKSVEQTEKRNFDIQSLKQTKKEADSALNEKAGMQNLGPGLDQLGSKLKDLFPWKNKKI